MHGNKQIGTLLHANIIGELRKANYYSVREFFKILGGVDNYRESVRMINMVEGLQRGRLPKLRDLVKIADKLGINVIEFFRDN